MAADLSARRPALDATGTILVEHIDADQCRLVDTTGGGVLVVFETTARTILWQMYENVVDNHNGAALIVSRITAREVIRCDIARSSVH
jgi:hypothetical protein